MKKNHWLILLVSLFLVSCGGGKTVKPTAKPIPPVASNPAPTSAPNPAPTQAPPTTTPAQTPSPADAQIGDNTNKPGGYYKDDGPEANPPKNLDSIPDATPKKEPLLARSNKPYKALGQTYVPLSSAQNYKERGLASWYGKRFHGKKTSSGEIYDMYAMSAAHTRLPLPSYVKVTNVANGRSVVVRVNDRGPFKSTRIIDLSYAAAYKLRLITKGSGMVEVEAIDPNQAKYSNSNTSPVTTSTPETQAVVSSNNAPTVETKAVSTAETVVATTPVAESKPSEAAPQASTTTAQSISAASSDQTYAEYFIQAGAFKSEANAETLLKRIQALEIEQNAGINRVYNNGLHRLKLGPYDSKQAAEHVAANIRKQLNIATLITNQ